MKRKRTDPQPALPACGHGIQLRKHHDAIIDSKTSKEFCGWRYSVAA